MNNFTKGTTILRASWNLWAKTALIWEAAVVWKNIGIAPEVSSAIVDVAEQLPDILSISTEIPWMGNFVEAAINSSEFLQNLAWDVHTAVNLWAYGSVFALIYFLWRLWFWEKWRFEAWTSTIVWSALSITLFKEMSDVLNGYWHDIMSWLPLRTFEAMPEALRESFMDADSRRNIYAGTTWALWVWTTYMAWKNIKRFLLWIPKKNKQ